ncbi:glycoside hydrolase family 19 protein [Paraburkholderia sp. EG285A]|uniref:glycoside hydrolase family 19 protein n=1 Tax=Paraburkholderia sp. EG285A TaxID=3237009 RepID=UPI0034D2199E
MFQWYFSNLLRVRKKPNGQIIGILPQRASVTVGKVQTTGKSPWGQLTDLQGALLYPTEAGGYVDPSTAIGGWIFLGQENGGPVAQQSVPATMFDKVIVPTASADATGAQQSNKVGIPVKAGDIMGHPGRFDPLAGNVTRDRRVHIEVFCDDSIVEFLSYGQEWISRNGALKDKWEELGLPPGPTLLRIDRDTILYHRGAGDQFSAGTDAQSNKTAVIQVYSLAELGRSKDNVCAEKTEDPISKRKVSWYQVEAANALGHAIKGWVREANHPGGGMVTREFAQKWVDFNVLPAEPHDTAHTIFATTPQWIDYMSKDEVPEPASREKLSPLMQQVYDAVFRTGNGKQAADELSAMSTTESDGYPWLMQGASRLIVKHESEWSNPSKWQELYSALGERSDAKSKLALEADQQRIPKLVWWDEVKAGVPGFPGPDVYHINPIAIVGNFLSGHCSCKDTPISVAVLQRIATRASESILNEYIDAINDTFVKYKFDSCISRAHFLAQILHESAEFSATVESGKDAKSYDPWRGRGLIQVTYEANYLAYEAYSGEDVTSTLTAMKKLEMAPHSVLSAAWFYAVLAGLIDPSNADDFMWVTRSINGAYTGYDDRLNYLNRAIDALGVRSCLVLNRNGVYLFEESRAYNEKRASCAWGMWNDPGLSKTGIFHKTAAEAIKGYRRYLELDDAAGRPVDSHGSPKDRGWYRVTGPIRPFVEKRLQSLSGV